MHGDQQSLWPDYKSHGSRSNLRKLFAKKPAEVARIGTKNLRRYAPNSYVIYHIFLVLVDSVFLRYSLFEPLHPTY
jgi:hypothetical protein